MEQELTFYWELLHAPSSTIVVGKTRRNDALHPCVILDTKIQGHKEIGKQLISLTALGTKRNLLELSNNNF